MNIVSAEFINGGLIPRKFACDGDNINPTLRFSEIPPGTKSLVLIVVDEDVPKHLRPDGMFDHWIVWNMPPTTKEILKGSTPPGVIGLNSRGSLDYTGPCPPEGEHRYFFYLYSLDTVLQLEKTSRKAELLKAMDGHVIEKSQLMGRYERKR